MSHWSDRFSHAMPWEQDRELSYADWKGKEVYGGDRGFFDDGGQWVPEDDIKEWIEAQYGIVEAEEVRYL